MDITTKQKLTIRIGRNSLSFSMATPENEESPITYEPYTVKSGISMAANLREAFKHADLLTTMNPQRVQVMLDTSALLIPVEVFEEKNIEDLFYHAHTQQEHGVVLYNVLPDLNAVAVFAINKDLKLVIDDHFKDPKFIHAICPVWRYLHQRSFTGYRNKLYGYFHDDKTEIFCFQNNRFKFCNTFDTKHAHDALYFLLYVWKQLALDNQYDELHIVGDIPERNWLTEELKKYLSKAYVINPSADFNRAPATQVAGLPYDLVTLYTKGR